MALFSKKDNVALDLQAISTIICEGSILTGNLKAPAYARIDGQVTGDISIDEGLIIGEKGIVHGNIVTKDMVVYGSVTGNLQVSSLEIKATGKISGDIVTNTLTVENGAVYDGSLSMSKNIRLAQKDKPGKPQQKAIEAPRPEPVAH